MTITEQTLSKARELALNGDLLRKHEHDMIHPAALWVALAEPMNEDSARDRETAERLFREYELRVYREEQLELLKRDVEEA